MLHNKKNLAGAALFLVAALALPGCGTQNVDKDTFVYGTTAYGVAMENAGVDPHDSYKGWSTIRYGIGETLFKLNDNMELEPWLAESFEQIDEYTVKVKVNDTAVFSNGKKVTGETVKKCLEDLLTRHDRAPRELKITSITADGQSVTITSAEKTPALLNYLADPYGCIIDVEEGIKDGIAVGTGPYKAIKVTDTQIDLVKNDLYWGNTKPQLEKIVVKSIPDGDTLTMAMQNGELDAAQGLPYASYDLFNDSLDKFKISQADTARVYQMAFNFKNDDLKNLQVRQAIAMAIDKERFAKVLLNGHGAAAVGPFPAYLPNLGIDVPAENAAKLPYSFDKAAAKVMLAQAGYADSDGDGYVDKDGKNLTLKYLTYTSRQELPLLAEFVEASLKDIGIKLDVNATDNYRAFLKSGDYDIFAKAIVTIPTGDPEYYYTNCIVPGAVDNAGFYDSTPIVEWEQRLHNTYGTAERYALARRINRQILEDCALVYVSHLRMSLVMKSDIEGFSAHPSDFYEITPELTRKK